MWQECVRMTGWQTEDPIWIYDRLVGFGRAACPFQKTAARTRLLELIATPNGRCAPHLPIAASLLLIRPPKINQIYRTRAARVKGFPENKCFSFLLYKIYPSWAAHVKGFFLSTGPQRLWNRRPPAPTLLIADLPAMFWDQNYVPVRPYARPNSFRFLYILIFSFVMLFLFFSPF
jgi:hypothetical protein